MTSPSTPPRNDSDLRPGAERALARAAAVGVELCLANPGTTELALVAALDATPGIRAVLCLFEGVCTGAADGYGRMLGKPALTLLHLGPGFANGIANLHNARRARSPIVNLIGDQASWHLGHDAPLTSDIESLARPVSDWLHTSASQDSLADDLVEAILTSAGPPAGVSTLIVPADHQAKNTASTPATTNTRDRPDSADIPTDGDLEVIVARLQKGDSAVLLLGGNALCEEGQRAASGIAQATGARLVCEPFPARWERGGGLPTIQRLPYFPEQAQALFAEADFVILAGAREPVSFFGYEGVESRLAPEDRLHCLSPAGVDAVPSLMDLARALRARDAQPAPGATKAAGPLSGALDSRTLGAVLAAHLPDGAIVMDESATSGLPFYEFSAVSARHTLLSLTGGAIGQGLPCAVGAALACPDRNVIAFQADGSGMYTLQSLWTMARENLNVVVVLCSNRAYRILQVEMMRTGNAEPGPKASRLTRLDQPELDWVALATGCGVPGIRVENVQEFDAALPRALRAEGPQLIELMI